jgi:hypothetical protein
MERFDTPEGPYELCQPTSAHIDQLRHRQQERFPVLRLMHRKRLYPTTIHPARLVAMDTDQGINRS